MLMSIRQLEEEAKRAREKKPSERQFKVGDRVLVNPHRGRIEEGIVKAVIHQADETRLQVDFGSDETALVYLWQIRPKAS